MAIPHAKSGDVVAIGIPPASFGGPRGLNSETLIRDEHVEVIRLVLQPGARLQEHQASGLLLIQCLHGEIELSAQGRTQRLVPGDLVHLRDAEKHAVTSTSGSVLLLTLFLHRV